MVGRTPTDKNTRTLSEAPTPPAGGLALPPPPLLAAITNTVVAATIGTDGPILGRLQGWQVAWPCDLLVRRMVAHGLT